MNRPSRSLAGLSLGLILALSIGVFPAHDQRSQCLLAAGDGVVSPSDSQALRQQEDRVGLEEALTAGLEEGWEDWQSPYQPASLALQRGSASHQTLLYRDQLRDALLPLIQRLGEESPLRDDSGRDVQREWTAQNLGLMLDTLVRAEGSDYPFWIQEGVVSDSRLAGYLQMQLDLEAEQLWQLATSLYGLMKEYAQLAEERGLSRRAAARLRVEGLRRLMPLDWLRLFAEQRQTTLSRAWSHVQSHWADPEGTWPVGGEPKSGLEELSRVREVALRKDQILGRFGGGDNPETGKPWPLGRPLRMGLLNDSEFFYVIHAATDDEERCRIRLIRARPNPAGAGLILASVFAFLHLTQGEYLFPLPLFPARPPSSAGIWEIYLFYSNKLNRQTLRLDPNAQGQPVRWISQPFPNGMITVPHFQEKQPKGMVWDPAAGRLLLLGKTASGQVDAVSFAPPSADTGTVNPRTAEDFTHALSDPVSVAADAKRGYVWVLDKGGILQPFAWDMGRYGHAFSDQVDLNGLHEGKGIPSNWALSDLSADPTSGLLLITVPASRSLWIVDPDEPALTVVRLDQAIPTPASVMRRRIPVMAEPQTGHLLLGNPFASLDGDGYELLILPPAAVLSPAGSGRAGKRFGRIVQDLVGQKSLGPARGSLNKWGIRLTPEEGGGALFSLFDRSSYPDSGGGWVDLPLDSGDLRALVSDGQIELGQRLPISRATSVQGHPTQHDLFAKAEVALAEGRLGVAVLKGPQAGLSLWYRPDPAGPESASVPRAEFVRASALEMGFLEDDSFWVALRPAPGGTRADFALLKADLLGNRHPLLLRGVIRIAQGRPRLGLSTEGARPLALQEMTGLVFHPGTGEPLSFHWPTRRLVLLGQLESAQNVPDAAGLEEPGEREAVRASFPADPRPRDDDTSEYARQIWQRLSPRVAELHRKSPVRTATGKKVLWQQVSKTLYRMVEGFVTAGPDAYRFWVQEGIVPQDELLWGLHQARFDPEDEQIEALAGSTYFLLQSYSRLAERGWPPWTIRSFRLAAPQRLVAPDWLERFARQRNISVERAWYHVRKHWKDPEGTWAVRSGEVPPPDAEEGPAAGLEEDRSVGPPGQWVLDSLSGLESAGPEDRGVTEERRASERELSGSL